MALLQQASEYVKAHMSQSRFDASHDWSHIQRVVQTSLAILAVESTRPQAPAFNVDVITLAALMHDVTDRKYSDPHENGDVENKISHLLVGMGADLALAGAVQTICKNVSYSHEMQHPGEVQEALRLYPELGIVQDADRLDAIGAVGIARVFAYTGAISARAGESRSLTGTIDHFHEKLEQVHVYMKTEEGRLRAKEHTLRLEQFRAWFEEETGTAS